MIFPTSEMNLLTPWDDAETPGCERSVKSAERTLALFELFSLCQSPQTIGQIVRAMKIPQPSVTMLVRNLVRLGYLEHNRTRRTYFPTLRIMLLGSWLHRRVHLEHDLEAHLDRLMRCCNETVLLGIQNSLYCQYIVAQMPDKPERLEIQSGMLRPMTRTAMGRVLLSMKCDAEISLMVRRSNAEFPDHPAVNQAELIVDLARVRRQGFAESNGAMSPGQSVIAVPIPTLVGNVPMVAGVGGPIDRIQEKRQEILAALGDLQESFAAANMARYRQADAA